MHILLLLLVFFDVRLAEAVGLRVGRVDDNAFCFESSVVGAAEIWTSIGSSGRTDDGDGSMLPDVVLSAVATGLNAPGCRRVVDDRARLVARFLGRSLPPVGGVAC